MRRLIVSTALGLGVFAGGAAVTVALAADSTTTTQPGAAVPGAAAKQQARTDHLKTVLDPLVKDGTITEAQRDKVIGALEAAKPPFGGGRGHGGRGGPRGPGGIVKAGLDEAAKIIGIDEATLRTELRGKSLTEVAKAHGVERQKLLDGLVAAATTRIDQAVKDAKLPQAQADALKKDLAARIGEMIDRVGPPMGGKGGPGSPGRHGRGPKDGGASPPSTTATTISLRTS